MVLSPTYSIIKNIFHQYENNGYFPPPFSIFFSLISRPTTVQRAGCRALRRGYATHRPPGRPPPCMSQRRKPHRGRTPGCEAARARCAAAASRMALAVRCCSRPPGLPSRPTHGPRRQGIRYGVRTGRGAVGMPWATSLWPKQRRMLLSLEMRVQHALWTHPEE